MADNPPISSSAFIDETAEMPDDASGHHNAATLARLTPDSIYHMKGNEDCIVQTIFVFLMTHAPETPDAPLQGIFKHADAVPYSRIVDGVWDLLGLVSASLVPSLEALFRQRLVQWPNLIESLLWMPQFSCDNNNSPIESTAMPGGLAEQSLDRPSDPPAAQQGSGLDDTISLTRFQWTVIREMICWSRHLEVSKAPGGGLCPAPFPRTGTSWDWAWTERIRSWEASLQRKWSRRLREASAAWYDTPATGKIKKLEQILDFVVRRLPLEKSAAAELDAANGADTAAGTSSVIEIYGLRTCLELELQRWQEDVQLIERARASRIPSDRLLPPGKSMNPLWTGFADSRSYRQLPAPPAPPASPASPASPPGIPEDAISAPKAKPRFPKPHPGLPKFIRSDMLDPKLSAWLDKEIASFNKPAASKESDAPSTDFKPLTPSPQAWRRWSSNGQPGEKLKAAFATGRDRTKTPFSL